MTKSGIRNCRLLTMEAGFPFYEHGAVLWSEDGVVLRAGEEREILADNSDASFRDMDRALVMPGLVNVHGHLYGFLARGISLKDDAPENFPQILERLWWRLDKALDAESIECSALVGLLDCVRGGTTTFIDHHASPNCIEGSLDIIASAAAKVGMRVCTCYEVSDRDGVDVRDRGLKENVRFIRANKPSSNSFLSSAFGIHASFTVSDETLEKISEMMPAGAGIHIHLCEDEADIRLSEQRYGARPVARLDRAGLLDGNALLAHGVHLTPDETALLADRACRLVHNPMSNMNNAVGAAPVLEFLQRGLLTGLGSDGYSNSMFDELAVCSILHKHQSHDPRKAFVEPFEMLFRNNPAIASPFFSVPVGTLEAGSAADFIVLPYDPPTPMSAQNLVGHCVFGFSRLQPIEVVTGGRTIFRDGRFPSLDTAAIAARARKASDELWKRF